MKNSDYLLEPLSINCIYSAHEGEGVRLGTPQIFVRVQGCIIGCLNCDSKETWKFEPPNATVTSVLEEIKKCEAFMGGKVQWISITGGDPLDSRHLAGVRALAVALKELRYKINIEAAGNKVSTPIFDVVDFISMDLKTPSTGVQTPVKNLIQVVSQYDQKYQIKSVIAHGKDFDFTLKTYERVKTETGKEDLCWVLTPCFEPQSGSLDVGLIEDIMRWNYQSGGHFRLIAQQHKWFYGPNKQKV
jgi:7-carboxy-7-deazaguanine synthase